MKTKEDIVRKQADPLGTKKATCLHTCRYHSSIEEMLAAIDQRTEEMLALLQELLGRK